MRISSSILVTPTAENLQANNRQAIAIIPIEMRDRVVFKYKTPPDFFCCV